MALTIGLGRVYDDVTPDEGTRALVDRLWPRGLHRDDPWVGRWVKEVAPSSSLRTWYGHRPDRREEFVRRYRAELADPALADALDELRDLARRGALTLVTATKNIEDSHLAVLKEKLEER